MGNCFRRFRRVEETYDINPSTSKLLYDVFTKLRQRGMTKKAAAAKTADLTGIHPGRVHQMVSAQAIFEIMLKKVLDSNARRPHPVTDNEPTTSEPTTSKPMTSEPTTSDP